MRIDGDASNTASADKVTISAQAQQASAQDDIEVEAQAIAKKAIDSPYWQKEVVPIAGWGGTPEGQTMSPANKKLNDSLDREFNSMFGTSQMNTQRFRDVQMLKAALGGGSAKQDFTEESLAKEAKAMIRAQDLISDAYTKQFGEPCGNIFTSLFGNELLGNKYAPNPIMPSSTPNADDSQMSDGMANLIKQANASAANSASNKDGCQHDATRKQNV